MMDFGEAYTRINREVLQSGGRRDLAQFVFDGLSCAPGLAEDEGVQLCRKLSDGRADKIEALTGGELNEFIRQGTALEAAAYEYEVYAADIGCR